MSTECMNYHRGTRSRSNLRSSNNLLRNMAISDDHFFNLEGRLDRVWLLVHPVELFEGSSL